MYGVVVGDVCFFEKRNNLSFISQCIYRMVHTTVPVSVLGNFRIWYCFDNLPGTVFVRRVRTFDFIININRHFNVY